MSAYDGDGETWRAWVADAMRSAATNGGKNRSVTEQEPASSVELSCQAMAAGNVARSMGALEASFAFPTPAEPGTGAEGDPVRRDHAPTAGRVEESSSPWSSPSKSSFS